MKKVAVVYSSKFGHTKQYADWLAADLEDVDVINVASFNPTQLLAYKLVIFASGVYSDKMPVMDFIKKNISAIKPNRTMVMAVSWYTNDSDEAKAKLIADNYPEEFKSIVPLYVVNSGIDKKQISPVDSMKLLAVQAMIAKKDGRSSDDINILSILKGYFDPTAKENLDSIKAGIEKFFTEPKKEAAVRTAPAVEDKAPEQPKPAPVPNPASVPKPAPATESVPKPMEVSEMKNEADALSSLENAFKALKAPKASASHEESAAVPQTEPKPAPAPAPQAEVKPVLTRPKVTPVQKAVVSSVKDALAAMDKGEAANYSPVPSFEDADKAASVSLSSMAMNFEDKAEAETAEPVPVIETFDMSASPESMAESSWESLRTKVVESVTESKPEPVAEAVPVKKEAEAAHAEHKNSYMELFAKRRRGVIDEEPKPAAEIKAEPAVPKAAEPKAVKPKPASNLTADDIISSIDVGISAAPKSVAPVAPAASSVDEMGGMDFDFIEDSKPTASKRALNAVNDLAKAKAEAEKEAAKAKAEAEKQAAEEEAEPHKQEFSNSFLEKMKHDMAALAEESEHEIEIEHEREFKASHVELSADEEDDELEGFTFDNDIAYDLSSIEIDTPPIGAVSLETIHKETYFEPEQHKTDFDLKKLQEEINASIETNRITKERMMNRYGKKQKEEVHNPFAVQFEEDESKSRKKKQAPEPKRLADPIDPDIFFNKPGKDYNATSDTMPEIKFNKR